MMEEMEYDLEFFIRNCNIEEPYDKLKEKIKFIECIIDTLFLLHSNNMVFCDLKP